MESSLELNVFRSIVALALLLIVMSYCYKNKKFWNVVRVITKFVFVGQVIILIALGVFWLRGY